MILRLPGYFLANILTTSWLGSTQGKILYLLVLQPLHVVEKPPDNQSVPVFQQIGNKRAIYLSTTGSFNLAIQLAQGCPVITAWGTCRCRSFSLFNQLVSLFRNLIMRPPDLVGAEMWPLLEKRFLCLFDTPEEVLIWPQCLLMCIWFGIASASQKIILQSTFLSKSCSCRSI